MRFNSVKASLPLNIACKNYRNCHGYPEAENKSLEIIEILLKAGADPNLPDKKCRPYGRFPIFAVQSYPRPMRLLTKYGASVDVYDSPSDKGKSSRYFYFYNYIEFLTDKEYNSSTDDEKFELFKIVVDASKKLNEPDIHLCTFGIRILRSLKRSFIRDNDNLSFKMFEYCLKNKKIDLSWDLGYRNYGVSLLHFDIGTLSVNHRKAIKLLVEAGADINALDKNGKTPLDWQLENKTDRNGDTIKFYRSLGAKAFNELKPESRKRGVFLCIGSQRKTIYHAIYNNDSKLLKELISKGADVNAPAKGCIFQWELYFSDRFPFLSLNKDNITARSLLPLNIACENYISRKELDKESDKTLEIIDMLLKAGADPNLSLNDDEYYVGLPIFKFKNSHPLPVKLLVKAGANVDLYEDSPEFEAGPHAFFLYNFVDFLTGNYCENTDEEKFELFKIVIDASKKLNDLDGYKCTPGVSILGLLAGDFSCNNVSFKMFEYCLKNKKVDPIYGGTLLHSFAGKLTDYDKKAIKLLVEAGENINFLDKDGKTSLDWLEEDETENANTIKFYRSLGAKTSKELKAESQKSKE